MCLAHLPPELLTIIASCVEGHLDLLAFAHTCKDMYTVALPVLLQDNMFYSRRLNMSIKTRQWEVTKALLRMKTHDKGYRLRSAMMVPETFDVFNELLEGINDFSELVRLDPESKPILHRACRGGSAKVVSRLLQLAGIDLNSHWSGSGNHLVEDAAVNYRYPEITSILLAAGAQWPHSRLKAFLGALENGNYRLVKYHAERGVLENMDDGKLNLSLKLLCQNVRYNTRAIVKMASIFPFIPLRNLFRASVMTACDGVVQLLLETQLDKISEELPEIMSLVNYDQPIQGKPPYQYYGNILGVSGSPRVMQLLLNRGCDVHALDAQGYPPLFQMLSYRGFWSSKFVDINMVRILLEHGADPNFTAADGTTALTCCFRNKDKKAGLRQPTGLLDIVKLLFEYGATVSEPKTDLEREKNPMNFVADGMSADRTAAVELLLQNGAKVDFKDNSGRTPLMHAIRLQNNALMLFLLKRGASLTERDDKQNSILSIVCETYIQSPVEVSDEAFDTMCLLQEFGLNISHLYPGCDITLEEANDIGKVAKNKWV